MKPSLLISTNFLATPSKQSCQYSNWLCWSNYCICVSDKFCWDLVMSFWLGSLQHIPSSITNFPMAWIFKITIVHLFVTTWLKKHLLLDKFEVVFLWRTTGRMSVLPVVNSFLRSLVYGMPTCSVYKACFNYFLKFYTRNCTAWSLGCWVPTGCQTRKFCLKYILCCVGVVC